MCNCKELTSGPPDGGWAWFVALGSFMALFVCNSWLQNYGQYFVYVGYMTGASNAQLAWIGTANYFAFNFFAPLGMAISSRFTHRGSVILGGITTTLALILPYSVTNATVKIYIISGGIQGFGAALAFGPSIVILDHYFDRKRGSANAVAFLSAGMSQLVNAPLIRYLLDEYSLDGAVLIHGCWMLHIIVAGAMFIPFHRPIYGQTDQPETETCLSRRDDLSQGDEFVVSESRKTKGRNNKFAILRTVSDPIQLCLMIVFSIATLIANVVVKYFPPRAQDAGLSSNQAAFILSLSGIPDIVGRILFGLLSDTNLVRNRIKCHRIWAAAIGLLGVVSILLGQLHTFETLFMNQLVIGFVTGLVYSMSTLSTLELVDREDYACCYSMMLFATSFSCFLDVFLVAELRDRYKSYSLPLGLCAALCFLASGLVFCLPWMKRRCRKPSRS